MNLESEIAHRFLSWTKGERKGPVTVQLNPTNRCNLKCRFCWLRDFDRDVLNLEEIKTPRYMELVKEAKGLDVRKFEITGGGEPMMRKDILEIMDEIKAKKTEGEMITNGTLFEEEHIKRIVEMEWDRILFSLDAPEEKMNNYLRGGGYKRVVWGIKKFQEIKEKEGAEKPQLSVHMVLCRANYEKLPQMIEFVHALNVDNVFVEPIVFLARKAGAGKELMLTGLEDSVNAHIQKAKKLCDRHRIQNNLEKLEAEQIRHVNRMDELLKKNFRIPCFQAWYHVVVRPWGSVGPCCMFDQRNENIRQKSLKEIWFGEYFEKIRENLIRGNLFEFCSRCNPGQVQKNEKVKRELERAMVKSMKILDVLKRFKNYLGI